MNRDQALCQGILKNARQETLTNQDPINYESLPLTSLGTLFIIILNSKPIQKTKSKEERIRIGHRAGEGKGSRVEGFFHGGLSGSCLLLFDLEVSVTFGAEVHGAGGAEEATVVGAWLRLRRLVACAIVLLRRHLYLQNQRKKRDDYDDS
ncbi:Zinc finger A20 and AN1 domain-containing stress-associated protein 1 [Senna tora]|uniref:Zinc finger A20 and AN1 domain-containing stress-associated protein 1 n=1 Tax=Senna tora TaxID=362788 RepID=A0A834TY73_9FABA|nr:Zinc finger A20 and AN1 domain-containing stress-associated protein 1 [Senna tora]